MTAQRCPVCIGSADSVSGRWASYCLKTMPCSDHVPENKEMSEEMEASTTVEELKLEIALELVGDLDTPTQNALRLMVMAAMNVFEARLAALQSKEPSNE